jgi:hypothetical protein
MHGLLGFARHEWSSVESGVNKRPADRRRNGRRRAIGNRL